MFTAVSSLSLGTATIWRLPVFAGGFVRLPVFADFSISMALEMTLDFSPCAFGTKVRHDRQMVRSNVAVC